MPAQLLVSPEEFDAAEVSVTGDRYRHLFRARRLSAGDRLRLVDGEGRARWGRVLEVDRSTARVEAGEPAPSHEAQYRLELLVAMPRRERASWLVEKATELGVSAIRWLATERSGRQPGDGTLDRFRRVAVAALEQSGRSRLPQISGPHAWSELPERLAGCDDRWWLDSQSFEESSGASGWNPSAGSGAVVIGPEGGWSAAEAQRLAELDCRPIRLGERILRVETAALVAVAGILADPGRPWPIVTSSDASR